MDSDVGVLLTAALLYGVAGSLALRIPRDLLGPDLDQARPAVREHVRHVALGLVDGLRHLGERRPAAYGADRDRRAPVLLRHLDGVADPALPQLLPRPGEADAAFNGLSVAVLVSGVGFVSAAVLTPVVTERIGAADLGARRCWSARR